MINIIVDRKFKLKYDNLLVIIVRCQIEQDHWILGVAFLLRISSGPSQKYYWIES